MIIISKDEVKKEMGVVPGELTYDFYIKEVDRNGTCYTPIKSPLLSKILSKQK